MSDIPNWSLTVTSCLYHSRLVTVSLYKSLQGQSLTVVFTSLQISLSVSSCNSLCPTNLYGHLQSPGITAFLSSGHCQSLEVTAYLYQSVSRSLYLSRPVSSDILYQSLKCLPISKGQCRSPSVTACLYLVTVSLYKSVPVLTRLK